MSFRKCCRRDAEPTLFGCGLRVWIVLAIAGVCLFSAFADAAAPPDSWELRFAPAEPYPGDVVVMEAVGNVKGFPLQRPIRVDLENTHQFAKPVDDRRWQFAVPADAIPGATLQLTIFSVPTGSTVRTTLKLQPLQTIAIEPTIAVAGQALAITVSKSHPLLVESTVLFLNDKDEVSGRAAVQAASGNVINVTIPPIPSGPVRVAVLLRGQQSPPFAGLTVQRLAISQVLVWPWWIGLVGLIVAISVFLYFRRPARRPASRPQAWLEDVPEPPLASAPQPADPLIVPELTVPQEVVEACLEGNCVLYAGAGLGARAGFPTWQVFVGDLLEWAIRGEHVDAATGLEFAAAMRHGSTDRVIDGVVEAVRDRDALGDMADRIREIFTYDGPLPDVHQLLPRLGLTAVLTTNFDNLLERALASADTPFDVYVPRDSAKLREALSQGRPFLLKLYGALDREDSLVVAPAQYEEKIQNDRPFADFVQQMFLTRTILFLGASLDGIEVYLKGLRMNLRQSVRHFAVVGVTREGWRADADAFRRRYGIEVLPYVPAEGHPQISTFVRELVDQVAKARASRSQATAAPELLQTLELRNIGPFEYLKIDFQPRWTILLGDNGVGKSTILRAIAVAVAGDQAGRLGARLLRQRSNPAAAEEREPGQITIMSSAKKTYATTISLNSLSQPEVSSIGPRAFAGSTLVLAFPAIRTIGAVAIPGPELKEAAKSPLASDVLPLLTGQPDPRILGFKQWIVNLDYLKRLQPSEASRVNLILDCFMKKMGRLLGSLRVESLEVADNDVWVQTDDGRLTIDSLSQGTVSILGWVALLTERLIDATGGDDSPAIVLIDEIDAHMHPEWQQAIVSRLCEEGVFPNVQFVVSTHSPFLAVGRLKGEVVRLWRHHQTGRPVAEAIDRDTKDLTVADALTGHLFGLQSQVDLELQRDILERRKLSVKRPLDEDDRRALAKLDAKLKDIGLAPASVDPLYVEFVTRLNRARGERPSAPVPLSREQRERKEKLVQEVIDELLQEERANRGSARE